VDVHRGSVFHVYLIDGGYGMERGRGLATGELQ
jgi:hypothetical protein